MEPQLPLKSETLNPVAMKSSAPPSHPPSPRSVTLRLMLSTSVFGVELWTTWTVAELSSISLAIPSACDTAKGESPSNVEATAANKVIRTDAFISLLLAMPHRDSSGERDAPHDAAW